ncbi:unnamed protein product [Paramecium primaurelia]|uniref:Adenylate kinase n=1 Tax=Paramecium primaurelia TaxID=5886 RepID=A0A8S1P066_PARPR|nr:unnamed protein product [Paramecium primaurelia]
MNTSELVEYQQKVEAYIKEHKMTDLFENLTRLLVLSKPQDPMSFLIDVLENRRVQRLILVTGVVATTRQEIVVSLANLFNYKVITIEDHFKSHWVNDDQVNEYIHAELKKTEKHFRGVIISGYPNNIKQAYYLQSLGILQERFFYLESDLDFCRQYYEQISQSQEEVTKALTRDRLNKKDLEYIYGSYMDIFNTSKRTKEDIIENIKQIIRLRDRKFPPLRFPRVAIIRPPGLKERATQLAQIFSKRYGLVQLITFDMIQQQIQNKGALGPLIYNQLQKEEEIPNDIMNSIVYTEVLSTEARTKGWVLEGFPKNEAQLKFLEAQNVNLFVVLNEDEDVLINKSKQLKIDPATKIKYEKVPLNNKPLLDRLQNYQIHNEQILKSRITKYQSFVKLIEQKFSERVQVFKLEKDSTENIIRVTDVFLNNPKIYN